MELGLALVVIVVAHLCALAQTLTSDATGKSKLGWSLCVLLLPVAGFLIWLIAGPRTTYRTTA